MKIADRLPPTHPRRVAELEKAAGMVAYARDEAERNAPWAGKAATTHFQRSDGWYVRETDQRGRVRESKIENPTFAIHEEPQTSAGPVDPDSITTLEHAQALSADQWASLPDEKREALLRAASEAQQERDLVMRRGTL